MDEHKLSGDAQPEPTEQPRRHSHKLLWIIGGSIIAVALIVSVILLLNQNKNGNENPANKQPAFAKQYEDVCKDRDVNFTSAPMNLDQLGYIRPLGAMLDGHVTPTDHVYVGGNNPQVEDNTFPVLMPADGTVVDVSAMPAQYIGDRQGTMLAPEDHRLVISHSCRYFTIYIHVHKLSDALKAALGGSLKPNESKRIGLELKAGDVVGYIGNSTFDWTPIDTSKTLSGFIHPDFYKGESWKIHTVSPFDLYTGKLKTDLEAKSLRTVAPLGGKIDYDQPGKLVGNWFREGTNGYAGPEGAQRYWDGHLSVVPDYISPSSTIVSTGNWNGTATQFVVSGSVDPANVGVASGMVKYELKKLVYVGPDGGRALGNTLVKGMKPSESGEVVGTIGLQVMADEKLKVENFVGKTADQITGFTSAAQTYER